MKVITLKEFGDIRFTETVKAIRDENNSYDRTNADWYDSMLEQYKSDRYLEWFFLMDEGTLAAFSSIQPYEDGQYRLLTRTYINRPYRRFVNPKDDTFFSPSMRILQKQVEYMDDIYYRSLFISMQDIKKRNTLMRFMNKCNRWTDLNWELDPNMRQTCGTNCDLCWQNVIYTGEPLTLGSLPVDEWKERYVRVSN